MGVWGVGRRGVRVREGGSLVVVVVVVRGGRGRKV